MRIFVTGASGWIGSALVPDLVAHGHEVVGLARSDASLAALTTMGATPLRGTLDDLDVLRDAAAAADGVVHLAFKHDLAFTGDFQGASDADRSVVETMLGALAGSDKPFALASGIVGIVQGRVATERDVPDAHANPGLSTRLDTSKIVVDAASRGIRTSVVRLPPTCHGEGDNGFMPAIVGVARAKGVSGYLGDGTNRWPATHRTDAARVFRLAVEKAPAGSIVHAVAEEGVAIRAVAEAIGRQLDVPVRPISQDEAEAHFGFVAHFIGVDCPASSAITRELLGWEPTGPTLLEDLDAGRYTKG